MTHVLMSRSSNRIFCLEQGRKKSMAVIRAALWMAEAVSMQQELEPPPSTISDFCNQMYRVSCAVVVNSACHAIYYTHLNKWPKYAVPEYNDLLESAKQVSVHVGFTLGCQQKQPMDIKTTRLYPESQTSRNTKSKQCSLIVIMLNTRMSMHSKQKTRTSFLPCNT